MNEYHVIDHHHDEQEGVYRLIIGVPYETERPVTDDEGNVVMDRIPLIGTDGEVQQDADGKEIYILGPAKFEKVVEHSAFEDFVFADDDERWQDKEPEEVAKAQRAEVRKVLREREKAQELLAAEQQAQRVQMPGTGKAL